ncbi:MAG: fermentation-respiration switch protein FrsA (DUF1100 family) [Chlamydiales bacterium]|jgi:fermentation-respiration switch protein FrsA (DUF1100 family)
MDRLRGGAGVALAPDFRSGASIVPPTWGRGKRRMLRPAKTPVWGAVRPRGIDRRAAAMLGAVRRMLYILLGGYLAICFLVWLLQAKLVWFPGPPPRSGPGELGWKFESATLRTTDGVRLGAWFLPVEGARGAVLISHGNAGSMEDRLSQAGAFRAMGLAVLLYDYRGYGDSDGSPSEAGTYLDARAALEHLVHERGFSPEQIVLYGESLGGAVTIELASARPVGAVIVESSFTRLSDVGARVYPWLPVRWLTRIHYASIERVARIDAALLVVHSPQDEIVPFTHAQLLFERARQPKRLLSTGGGHNGGGFTRNPDWRRAVADFIAQALE